MGLQFRSFDIPFATQILIVGWVEARGSIETQIVWKVKPQVLNIFCTNEVGDDVIVSDLSLVYCTHALMPTPSYSLFFFCVGILEILWG